MAEERYRKNQLGYVLQKTQKMIESWRAKPATREEESLIFEIVSFLCMGNDSEYLIKNVSSQIKEIQDEQKTSKIAKLEKDLAKLRGE